MPQLHNRAPGRSEFRVVLNPTREPYGATWIAECKTRAQVWDIIDWMMEDTPHISTEWKISVSDEPMFGGEHSDTYLYVDRNGYHGRWAEEAVARA